MYVFWYNVSNWRNPLMRIWFWKERALLRTYFSKKERLRIISLQFADSWIANFHLNRLTYIDVPIIWSPHSPDLTPNDFLLAVHKRRSFM